MNLLLLILLAGGLTFLIRLSFIALLTGRNVPRWFTQALRFVPAAVLSAIIATDVLTRDSQIVADPSNKRLIAAVIAGVVAWRTKHTLLTIAVGMIALWLLQAI